MTELHQLTVRQLSDGLHKKQFSACELAQHFLARITRFNELNSFVDQNEELTLAQAQQADELLTKGNAPLLAGIPIAHKDIFVTKDFNTTVCSKMLEGYRSPFDATVVSKLTQQGMVTLGKVSCDEFAMGATNEKSYFGAVLNPWNLQHVPGGSSGGSAVAVAARLAPVATGTDTGGSIRQPASFCGITGIKPTYGRVSRYGMIAFASSLDQAGPMAKTAEDCALLLQAMAGADLANDATSVNKPVPDYCVGLDNDLTGLRIGVPKEFFVATLPNDIQQALQQALQQYQKLGAILVDISLPLTELSIPAYYVLAPAEASSNLSRYDGVKFGYRAQNYQDLNDMYVKTRTEGFGEEVKRRIMIGTYVLSHGYYDAYYLKAQKIRRLIANDFKQAFNQCDVIAGPVAPTVAPKLNEFAKDPIASYLADIFTLPASLAGLPAMSLPVGVSQLGLPIGLQLIGNYFSEDRLLNVAHKLQSNTDFHLQQPAGV